MKPNTGPQHARNSVTQSGFYLRPKVVALAVAACFSGTVLANPTNPAVVSGTAAFQQSGGILNVTNSHNAIINWGSFSIGVNELTKFIQPSALSAVLNRVVGQDPSAILGALQSNGRVFLINPNGILFGAGAQINVGGLIASTLNLSNADFLAGRMNFTDGVGAGSVVNQGSINASGGPVYMVGNAVTNNGIITSPGGEVVLAAGNSVELVNPGTPNLRVEIQAGDNEARNLGSVVADAGRIGIYAGLIKQGGVLNADSAVNEGGRIMLKSTKRTDIEAGSITSARGTSGGEIIALSGMTDGVTAVAGTLDASAFAGDGGFIETSAATVKVADSTVVTTKGGGAGRTGTWLIDPKDYKIGDTAYGGDISGSTLGSNLGSSSVVIMSDQGATEGNGDIIVNDSVSWTASNSLTLLAKRNVTINNSIDGGGDLLFHAGWNGGSTTTPVVTSGIGDITSTYDRITTKGNVLFQAGRDILLGATNVWSGQSYSNGVAADSLAKSIKLNAGRNLELTAPDGGTEIMAVGNSRSSATVLLEAKTGSITVEGSQVKAQGGAASNGAKGGDAVVLMSAKGGLNVSSGSIVSARGGSSDSGQGGAAAVTLLAGGSVVVDGSEGVAFGGSGTTGGGSAAVNVVAGGDITVQDKLSGDGLRADAGSSSTVSSVVLAAAGNVNLASNSRIDTDGVAGLGGVNISLNNADVYGGTGISISATGKLDLAGGSYLGTNSGIAYVNTGGNVTVNDSRIYAPDVTMNVGGVINMNSGGTIGASLPSTIRLTFPKLTSGGYFVNGVEGVVYDVNTSTGFCSPNCPAVLGTNLLVTYGGTTARPDAPTNVLIVAMNNATKPDESRSTGAMTSDDEEDKKDKKKDAPVCR